MIDNIPMTEEQYDMSEFKAPNFHDLPLRVYISLGEFSPGEVSELEEGMRASVAMLRLEVAPRPIMPMSANATVDTLHSVLGTDIRLLLHIVGLTAGGIATAAGLDIRKRIVEIALDRMTKIFEARKSKHDAKLEPAVLYGPEGDVILTFRRPKNPD